MTQRTPIWLRGVPGATAGLFLARVALEATRRPWPGALVVTIGLLAALGGFALSRRLASRSRPFVIRHWSLVILLAYVLWPRRDPLAAASVAILAALAWLLSVERPSLPRWVEPLADGATFAVALVVYVATAAPDVLPADAGEFQLVASLLGVAHPPGYPLYTLAGHLFIRFLPWGTPAYRLNLMSTLLAAGTLVLVARATRRWARRLDTSPLVTVASGLAAALTLGTATTFWAQATIANVRTLAVFFAALALYALSWFAAATERREADRALVLLGLALGLGLSHYPPLAFVSLFFVFYVLLADPRLAVQPRRWWRAALVGLVSFLLPLAYLLIRGAMGAPLAPEGLDTLPGFLHHVLARGFAGDMFAFANVADLPHRLALLPTLFPFQFNVLLLVAALLGLLGLLGRDRRLFVLLAGSLALHTFVTITYRAPQTVEYLMPAYLPVAIAIGLLPSLSYVQCSRSNVLRCSLAAAVLWAGLLNGWAHGPSFVELADDHTARQTVAPLLEQAPAGALILADWHWVTPLWYLQWIEGLRPDVEVRYVYPVPGQEYRDTWADRLIAVPPQRPVIVTHYYDFAAYTAEPLGAGFLLRPRPVSRPVAPLTPVDLTFGGMVRVLGYSVETKQPRPGQVVEFTLAWQPTGPLERAPSLTLRLADEDNPRLAQADRSLGTSYTSGEVRFERLALPLYPALTPGRYQVVLGAYAVTDVGPALSQAEGFEPLPLDDGASDVTLTQLEVAPPVHCPFTLHWQDVPFAFAQGRPFADGPTLVGVDYDRSVPDTLRVYLHWRGPAEPDWRVRVEATDGAGEDAPLPPIPARACQTLVLDLPGEVTGALRLTLTDGGDGHGVAAGPWGWPTLAVRLPPPGETARFVPLGDEMALVGVAARPAAPGETMAVDATLVALRPLTDDDATSVRLFDSEGRWLSAHDSQPALGAIPTLKWIRGSRIVDRHPMQIPSDFSGEGGTATLVAYEQFRGTPLVPLDGRMAAIPLGEWLVQADE